MRIAVVSASLSDSSTTNQLGEALAEAVVGELGGTFEMISLRENAHAIMDNMLTGFPNAELEDAFAAVAEADAVVAVTPAYNASYSGLFKSFFDVLPQDALRGKPVAIGVTGGTPRHSLVTEHVIRPMFSYLRAITAPTAVFAATEDFGAHAGDSDARGGASISTRIARAAGELAAIVRAPGLADVTDAGVSSGVSSRGTAAGKVGESRSGTAADVAAARELFDDFKPMDELLG